MVETAMPFTVRVSFVPYSGVKTWRINLLAYICGGGFVGKLALPFFFYTTATLQITYSETSPILLVVR